MKITASRGRLIVFTLGLSGIFALAGGSVLFGFFDRIVNFFMKKDLVLKEGSEFFDIWKDVPIPIYQKIYIFNVTNPDGFAYEGEKPVLQELGPYVFRGRWMKEDIEFNDEAGTITYRDVKDYVFEPEMSSGDQEDMIYTLNAPMLAVINHVDQYAPAFFRSFVVDIMNGIFESYNETLLVHRSVREMIYEGYHEPMVADLVKVVEPFLDLPLTLVNDTFGILHEKKHVGDGIFTVKSGSKGLKDYGSIQSWNNQSSVTWWDGEACNKFTGSTDGVQYAPNVLRNETLAVFNPHLCRSLPLQYVKDTTVHGIKAYRFSMPSNVFGTADENPDNKCYCSGPHCPPSGIMPLNCKKGAPYVLSLPHFYEADPQLKEAVTGVNASAKLHKTFVDVEPQTGLVLNAAVKLELNAVVQHLPEYKALEYVGGDSIIPVMWLSEEATLDAFFANYFKSRVQKPIIMFRVTCISAIVIGGFWTISSIVFLFCIQAKIKNKDINPLKNSVVLKTLNQYTGVALWPPEEETKDGNISEKTHL